MGRIKMDDIERDIKESIEDPKPFDDVASLRDPEVEKEPIRLSEISAEKEKVSWIWDGFLCSGHKTLFSALWKSGKSTLIGHLLKAIEEKKPLAGQETKKSKVLILSEESEYIWSTRREEQELKSEDVWIFSKPLKTKLNFKQWEEFVIKISKFDEKEKIDLVIIDTISDFWSVYQENDASQTNMAIKPLDHLTDLGASVLLIHHFRKGGGSEFVASRGSGAISSAVDIIMEFRRLDLESPTDTKRVLKSISRFQETPREVVIELVDNVYYTRGTKQEVSKEAKLMKILLILEKAERALTAQDVVDNWDVESDGRAPNKRTIQRHIKTLIFDGRIIQDGEQRVGKIMAPTYTTSDKDSAPNRDGSVVSRYPRLNGGNEERQPKNEKARQATGQNSKVEANKGRHDTPNSSRDAKEDSYENVKKVFGV